MLAAVLSAINFVVLVTLHARNLILFIYVFLRKFSVHFYVLGLIIHLLQIKLAMQDFIFFIFKVYQVGFNNVLLYWYSSV